MALADAEHDASGAPVLRDQGPIGRPGTARLMPASTPSLPLVLSDTSSAPSGNVCPVDDFAESLVMGVTVPPGEVAADHAALFFVAGVVGAVEGEIAQRGEVALDPVEVARVGRGVGQLDVVGPAAQSPTRASFLVVRCALALSSTIPSRTPCGYSERT